MFIIYSYCLFSVKCEINAFKEVSRIIILSMHIAKEYINITLLTSKRNYQLNDVMIKNALHTQVLMLIALLLIKIIS